MIYNDADGGDEHAMACSEFYAEVSVPAEPMASKKQRVEPAKKVKFAEGSERSF